jgi:hypothetical protein
VHLAHVSWGWPRLVSDFRHEPVAERFVIFEATSTKQPARSNQQEAWRASFPTRVHETE